MIEKRRILEYFVDGRKTRLPDETGKRFRVDRTETDPSEAEDVKLR